MWPAVDGAVSLTLRKMRRPDYFTGVATAEAPRLTSARPEQPELPGADEPPRSQRNPRHLGVRGSVSGDSTASIRGPCSAGSPFVEKPGWLKLRRPRSGNARSGHVDEAGAILRLRPSFRSDGSSHG